MVKDRQFICINLEEIRSKRDSDTGPTIKEWCLLAGYSYSKGRAIVARNGFPIFEEKSFGAIGRRNQVGLETTLRSQKPVVRNSTSLDKFYARRRWS